MKTLLVFSDSHNESLPPALYEAAKSADYVLFLGDGIMGLKDFAATDNFLAVKGNCDFIEAEKEMLLNIEGVNVFMCHGDQYLVKNDLLRLYFAAKEKGASLVLFGHTHDSLDKTADGIRFINPGSISRPRLGHRSYAFITIKDRKILNKIVEVH